MSETKCFPSFCCIRLGRVSCKDQSFLISGSSRRIVVLPYTTAVFSTKLAILASFSGLILLSKFLHT
jgi:hypothetical protein